MIQKLARLFGIGQLPGTLRNQIDAEGGWLWLEEGISVTAILRGFKAPGNCCSYRQTWFIGFAALTRRRMIVSAGFYNKAVVNVPYDDPHFKDIDFSLEGNRVCLSFNPARFLPDTSGDVTLRLGVTDVPTLTRVLSEKGVRL
jgi:hypothetical protein